MSDQKGTERNDNLFAFDSLSTVSNSRVEIIYNRNTKIPTSVIRSYLFDFISYELANSRQLRRKYR